MSIDFRATVTQSFDVETFRRTVDARLADLVGSGHPPLEAAFWKTRQDYSQNVPPITESLNRWRLGHGEPSRWLVLSLAPNVNVDVATDVDEPDLSETIFTTMAGWRTASSVLVATAALIAGVELGLGGLDPDRKLVDAEGMTPRVLLETLRLTDPPPDLEDAARQILRRTPGFANWAALDD